MMRILSNQAVATSTLTAIQVVAASTTESSSQSNLLRTGRQDGKDEAAEQCREGTRVGSNDDDGEVFEVEVSRRSRPLS